MVLPGRKSAFRAIFWPDSYRESTEIEPPAGRRADFDVFLVAARPKYRPKGRFTVRKHYSCLTFRLIFYFCVRGLRFRGLGVDSGPRGEAFEGVSDPPKIIKNTYFY